MELHASLFYYLIIHVSTKNSIILTHKRRIPGLHSRLAYLRRRRISAGLWIFCPCLFFGQDAGKYFVYKHRVYRFADDPQRTYRHQLICIVHRCYKNDAASGFTSGKFQLANLFAVSSPVSSFIQ